MSGPLTYIDAIGRGGILLDAGLFVEDHHLALPGSERRPGKFRRCHAQS